MWVDDDVFLGGGVGIGTCRELQETCKKEREGVGCRDKCMEYGDVLLFFRGDR